MTTAEIESLLERVRSAMGPSIWIDLELLKLWEPGHDALKFWPDEYQTELRPGCFSAWKDGHSVSSPFPQFTASVDSCLALIERALSGKDGGPLLYARKTEWAASAQPGYLATLHVAFGDPADPQTFWAQAATEPLALLTALLLALLHQASDKGMIDAE